MALFLYICGAIVVMAAAAKSLPSLGRSIWRFAKAAAKVPIVLETIAHEFNPNGGESLRDSIDRLEVALAAESARQTSHQAAVASILAAEQERVAARLEEQQAEMNLRMRDVTEWMHVHSVQDQEFSNSVHQGLDKIQELVSQLNS